MIDEKIKNKLVKELEKNGNIFISCLKTNIARSTFYRWRKTDKIFAKLVNIATRMGRDNMCDVAEGALMQNVKNKKMDAIKYVLSHNSQRYKPKTRKVYIEHSNSAKDFESSLKEKNEKELEKVRMTMNKMMEITKNDVLEKIIEDEVVSV